MVKEGRDAAVQITPGNVARGVANEVTLGFSEIPVGVYGMGKATWEGSVDIASGKTGEGVQKITPVVLNILAILLLRKVGKMGTAIVTEAALSFLGVGVQPPTPSWGAMLRTGSQYLEVAPWIGLAFVLAR